MDVRGFQAGSVVATQSMRTMQAAATETSLAMGNATRAFTLTTVAAKGLSAATSTGALLVVSLIAAVVQHARAQNAALKEAEEQQQKLLRGLKESAEKIKFETREIAAAQSAGARAGMEWADAQIAAVNAAAARGRASPVVQAMTRQAGLPMLSGEEAEKQKRALEAWRATFEGTYIAALEALRKFDREAEKGAATEALKRRMDAARESVKAMTEALQEQEREMRYYVAWLERWTAQQNLTQTHRTTTAAAAPGVHGVPSMPVLSVPVPSSADQRAQIEVQEASRKTALAIGHLGDVARNTALAMVSGLAASRIGGPIGGAISGVSAGLAAKDPLAAIIGGVAGFVGGLFDEADRAKEADRQMREALAAWHDSLQQMIDAVGRSGLLGQLEEQIGSVIDAYRKQFANLGGPVFEAGSERGSAATLAFAGIGGASWEEYLQSLKDAQSLTLKGSDQWKALGEAIALANALIDRQRELWAEAATAMAEDYRVRLLVAQGNQEAADAMQAQLDLQRALKQAHEDLGDAFTPELEALIRQVYQQEALAAAQAKANEAAQKAADEAERQAAAERELAQAHKEASDAARQAAIAATDVWASVSDRLVNAGLLSPGNAFALKQTSEMNRWIEQGLPQWLLDMLGQLQVSERDQFFNDLNNPAANAAVADTGTKTDLVQSYRSITAGQAVQINSYLSRIAAATAQTAQNTMSMQGATETSMAAFTSAPVASLHLSSMRVFASNVYISARSLVGVSSEVDRQLGEDISEQSYNSGVVQLQ